MVHITFDVASLRTITLSSHGPDPPICHQCHGPSMKLTTRSSNRSGNAGRPYYKCVNCGKFLAFADNRGNDPTNPLCLCGVSSKRQVASPAKGRIIHYVCRLGGCDFYAPCLNKGQDSVSAESDEVVKLLAGLRLV